MKPINPAFADRDEELAHGWICQSDQRRKMLKPVASFDADLAALRALLMIVRGEEREQCAVIAETFDDTASCGQGPDEIANMIRHGVP